MIERRLLFRRVRMACITVGAVAGAILPLVTHEASNHRFTDIEAVIGYGIFAITLHAAFGALGGWAIGALISHFAGDRP